MPGCTTNVYDHRQAERPKSRTELTATDHRSYDISDHRVYVVKQRRIMNESLSRSFLSMVPEGEDTSSVNAVQRRSICRRSDKIRPGLTRPTISHEPPITRIGSLNAQSVGNKFAAICDRIATEKLHLCAIVETWHDSANSPQLIACAPPRYNFVEKARPRDGSEDRHLASEPRRNLPVPRRHPYRTRSSTSGVQILRSTGSEHPWCAT